MPTRGRVAPRLGPAPQLGRKAKTLWEKNKNTVGAIQKHYGRKTKTLWEREGASTVFFVKIFRF